MVYNDDQCETTINVFVGFIRKNNVNMVISLVYNNSTTFNNYKMFDHMGY